MAQKQSEAKYTQCGMIHILYFIYSVLRIIPAATHSNPLSHSQWSKIPKSNSLAK